MTSSSAEKSSETKSFAAAAQPETKGGNRAERIPETVAQKAEAIKARDEDKARIDLYAEACLETFHGFKIPFLGSKKRVEADQALKNFARNPGTKLYDVMIDGTHTYEVVALQKVK